MDKLNIKKWPFIVRKIALPLYRHRVRIVGLDIVYDNLGSMNILYLQVADNRFMLKIRCAYTQYRIDSKIIGGVEATMSLERNNGFLIPSYKPIKPLYCSELVYGMDWLSHPVKEVNNTEMKIMARSNNRYSDVQSVTDFVCNVFSFHHGCVANNDKGFVNVNLELFERSNFYD